MAESISQFCLFQSFRLLYWQASANKWYFFSLLGVRLYFNPIRPGLFEGGWAFGGEWRRKVPAAHNYKRINDNEMKSGVVVENYKVTN